MPPLSVARLDEYIKCLCTRPVSAHREAFNTTLAAIIGPDILDDELLEEFWTATYNDAKQVKRLESFWTATCWLGVFRHFDQPLREFLGDQRPQPPSLDQLHKTFRQIDYITEAWGPDFWHQLRRRGVNLPALPAKNFLETFYKTVRRDVSLAAFARGLSRWLPGYYTSPAVVKQNPYIGELAMGQYILQHKALDDYLTAVDNKLVEEVSDEDADMDTPYQSVEQPWARQPQPPRSRANIAPPSPRPTSRLERTQASTRAPRSSRIDKPAPSKHKPDLAVLRQRVSGSKWEKHLKGLEATMNSHHQTCLVAQTAASKLSEAKSADHGLRKETSEIYELEGSVTLDLLEQKRLVEERGRIYLNRIKALAEDFLAKAEELNEAAQTDSPYLVHMDFPLALIDQNIAFQKVNSEALELSIDSVKQAEAKVKDAEQEQEIAVTKKQVEDEGFASFVEYITRLRESSLHEDN